VNSVSETFNWLANPHSPGSGLDSVALGLGLSLVPGQLYRISLHAYPREGLTLVARGSGILPELDWPPQNLSSGPPLHQDSPHILILWPSILGIILQNDCYRYRVLNHLLLSQPMWHKTSGLSQHQDGIPGLKHWMGTTNTGSRLAQNQASLHSLPSSLASTPHTPSDPGPGLS
jgi:hypothetical protein